MIYAEIIDGQIAQYITASGPLPAHKLRHDLLPVVEVEPVFDPQTEIVTGTDDVLLSDRIERRAVIGNRPPDPIPQEVTETQFIRATVKAGFISYDEGAGYLARGELPLMMAAALAKIPAEVRDDMTLKAIGSASFSRSDPVFLALVGAGVATDEQIDDVFRLAASLT